MAQKRSARCALVRRRNMSQATALRVNEVLLGSGMSGGVEQVDMNYGSSTAVPVSSKAPVFSDIAFRNIEIKGAKVGVEVCGLPESPVKVRLDKVEMQVEAAA